MGGGYGGSKALSTPQKFDLTMFNPPEQVRPPKWGVEEFSKGAEGAFRKQQHWWEFLLYLL